MDLIKSKLIKIPETYVKRYFAVTFNHGYWSMSYGLCTTPEEAYNSKLNETQGLGTDIEYIGVVEIELPIVSKAKDLGEKLEEVKSEP